MPGYLGAAAVIASGFVAGVLFSVALSVVPAFLGLPPDRYVEIHKLVGRRYDRVMPPLVLTYTLLDLFLAARAEAPSERALLAAAAACGLGTALVSQLGNVPINRRVKSLPPGAVPAGWDDPRARWRGFNLVRTGLAACGFVLNAGALLLR